MQRLTTTILLSLTFLSCTETVPFEPEITGRTDWAPAVLLDQNGYNRFAVRVSRPPWKELLRNISHYTVEVRELPAGSFVRVDSLRDTYFTSFYGNYISGSGYYSSEPILQYDCEYQVRIAVHYKDGTTRPSPEVSFRTPRELGKVLAAIPFPDKVGTGLNYPIISSNILFVRDRLYVVRDEQLFQVDTSTGQSTIIEEKFVPPTQATYDTFRSFSAWGDRILTFYYDRRNSRIELVGYNTVTESIDYTSPVTWTGDYPLAISVHESYAFLVWGTLSGQQQQYVTEINLETGQIIVKHPKVPARISYPYNIYTDGSSIWASGRNTFDNRIIRYDILALSVIEEHRNPILRPDGLSWDGEHFWVIDEEANSIVKLQLEGL